MSHEQKVPATLSPDDTDATIFDVMAASGLVLTHAFPNGLAIWSRSQMVWLSPAEYAAEWRHRWRYRQRMGTEEEARASSDYERSLGL